MTASLAMGFLQKNYGILAAVRFSAGSQELSITVLGKNGKFRNYTSIAACVAGERKAEKEDE